MSPVEKRVVDEASSDGKGEDQRSDRRAEGGGGRISAAKEAAEAFDAWFGVILKFCGLGIVVLLLFLPSYAPILHRFVVKSSEINILGQQIQIVDKALIGNGVEITDDGKLQIAGVDINQMLDQYQKLQQSVSDLQRDNDAFAAKIKTDEGLLSDATAKLDEANKRLVAASASAVSADQLSASIATARADAAKQLRVAAESSQQAAKVISESNPSVALPGVGFGVVFGADASPAAAMDEVRKITRPPISASPVLIYKRQGQWRSVAYFGTRAAANKELSTIRTVKPDAYVVDISAWCPTPVKLSAETTDMAELKDCQF